jgi:hypothetical protein
MSLIKKKNFFPKLSKRQSNEAKTKIATNLIDKKEKISKLKSLLVVSLHFIILHPEGIIFILDADFSVGRFGMGEHRAQHPCGYQVSNLFNKRYDLIVHVTGE